MLCRACVLITSEGLLLALWQSNAIRLVVLELGREGAVAFIS